MTSGSTPGSRCPGHVPGRRLRRPRLGEPEDVAAITPGELYRHYRQVLGTSQVELFYAGSAPLEAVAELLRRVLQELPRQTPEPLPFASMGRRGSPSIWKKPWT